MVDTFYSLHCAGVEEPIYISEVVEKTMVSGRCPAYCTSTPGSGCCAAYTNIRKNPNFQSLDLTNYGPSITRQSRVTVKVWIKRRDFSLFLQQDVNLGSLSFIGTLQNRHLPPNTLLFYLVDGIYALELPEASSEPKHITSLPTASYSALMRLSTLDESIQDALATREEITGQINAILADQHEDETATAQEKAQVASSYLKLERKLLKQSRRSVEDMKASIAARRSAMESIVAQRMDSQAQEPSGKHELDQLIKEHEAIKDAIHGQRRRVCEELNNLFPIEATSRALVFKICGLTLPNTDFEDNDPETTDAALGYVARLVDMLQYYLAVPLPYRVVPYGSKSVIRDEISMLPDRERVFPLYGKGTITFRFEYGVFLLNKNIEALAESQKLRLVDIRHTLPNLKYILYVCSAGSSELPARKSGGVRGLLSSALTTPVPSRQASQDRLNNEARSKVENGTARYGAVESLAMNLPFDGQTTSLRTKGMRERRT
jgi:hypothetical protein